MTPLPIPLVVGSSSPLLLSLPDPAEQGRHGRTFLPPRALMCCRSGRHGPLSSLVKALLPPDLIWAVTEWAASYLAALRNYHCWAVLLPGVPLSTMAWRRHRHPPARVEFCQ